MLSDSAILLVYRGSVILSQTAVDALSTRQFTQSTLGCRGNQMVPAISPNGFSPSAVRPCISAASFAPRWGRWTTWSTSGRFALLKIYPICRWSGELGPKTREGDRQAPEGFYTVTPGQMNPNSHYYLSFDIGYPNAYDRAYGRTGSNIMVHGDCSSRGCYAMTDEQISEIYALARESFLGNQQSFQVQAYPFRMTPPNMAKHRSNPNMPFWKMLKEALRVRCRAGQSQPSE